MVNCKNWYVYCCVLKNSCIKRCILYANASRYANAKCGLMNSKSKENECFKWCRKYQQSEKEASLCLNSKTATDLCTYDYNDMECPAVFTCIAFLEENKWSIFTGFHKEDKIRRSRVGHLDYFLGKRPNICATKWWRRQITLRLHKNIGHVFNLHTQCLRQR